ncbi:MAG: hypothetical protein AAFY59_17235, partial [Pseudomonadota bacterium]
RAVDGTMEARIRDAAQTKRPVELKTEIMKGPFALPFFQSAQLGATPCPRAASLSAEIRPASNHDPSVSGEREWPGAPFERPGQKRGRPEGVYRVAHSQTAQKMKSSLVI